MISGSLGKVTYDLDGSLDNMIRMRIKDKRDDFLDVLKFSYNLKKNPRGTSHVTQYSKSEKVKRRSKQKLL